MSVAEFGVFFLFMFLAWLGGFGAGQEEHWIGYGILIGILIGLSFYGILFIGTLLKVVVAG
ncbi:hypothetical protein LCGC14_0593310 [marine sediment metagenome]|uniref:Uncharacterized protein n=1 Tax=marine sediment metagenome TaxID=412755 RepID=A0A0F9ULA6_9ZZZZ